MKNVQNRLYLILFFFIFNINFLSCKEKSNKLLKTIIENKEITVLGGLEEEENNFVLLGINVDNNKLGNVLLIIFNKKYEIINYTELFRHSSNLPIDYTEKYFAFYLRPRDNSKSHIIVYNIKEQNFENYEIGYPFLWNIYINDNNLFFSTYMANPNLNVINLQKKVFMPFSDFECGSVNFGNYNGTVYGGFEDDKYLYRWTGTNFEQTQEIKFEQLDIRNKCIEDFKIEENILVKLKLK